jgi:hypothetical protein
MTLFRTLAVLFLCLALGAFPAVPQDAAAQDDEASPRVDMEASWQEMYPMEGDPDDRYALLVGISDYPGRRNDLAGPRHDVREMRDLLVEQYDFKPDNVVVLEDAQGNREHIVRAFTRHLGQAGPDGTAVFYYSGHGLQLDVNTALRGSADPEAGDGVDEALYVWSQDRKGGVLVDDELNYLVNRLKAKRTLVIMDNCNAGTGTRGEDRSMAEDGMAIRRVRYQEVAPALSMPETMLTDTAAVSTPRAAPRMRAPRGADEAARSDTAAQRTSAAPAEERMDIRTRASNHVLLAASRPDQVSLEVSDLVEQGRAGVFTHYLIDALRSADAQTTFETLIKERVRPKVRQKTEPSMERYGYSPQEPQVEGRPTTESIATFLKGE